MSRCRTIAFRFAILILASTWFLSGCSGSNDDSLEHPNPPESTDAPNNPALDSETEEPDPPAQDSPVAEPVPSDPQDPEPAPSDPPAISSTRVQFDITVPAYKSKELQVKLEWGDKVLSAAWVADELWTVEDDFPTDVANRLFVSFNDRNGGIALASYENIFLTGMAASETYQISADEFVLDMWDSDSDGISNLDELIAGTDPEVVQVVKEGLLSFSEPYSFWGINPLRSLSIASGHYEPRIPAQRPYSEHSEYFLPYDPENFVYDPEIHEFNWPVEVKHIISIEIDESGTGSFSDTHRVWEPSNRHPTDQIATRTEIDAAVFWVGSFYEYDSSAHRGMDLQFSTESRVIDAETRWQQGTVKRATIGLPIPALDVSYTLTGTITDDSSYCSPDFGMMKFTAQYITEVLTNNSIEVEFLETTVSKQAAGHKYWSVVDKTIGGDIVEEYLIPSVAGASFFCDY